jgi:hypothetical protein
MGRKYLHVEEYSRTAGATPLIISLHVGIAVRESGHDIHIMSRAPLWFTADGSHSH